MNKYGMIGILLSVFLIVGPASAATETGIHWGKTSTIWYQITEKDGNIVYTYQQDFYKPYSDIKGTYRTSSRIGTITVKKIGNKIHYVHTAKIYNFYGMPVKTLKHTKTTSKFKNTHNYFYKHTKYGRMAEHNI